MQILLYIIRCYDGDYHHGTISIFFFILEWREAILSLILFRVR